MWSICATNSRTPVERSTPAHQLEAVPHVQTRAQNRGDWSLHANSPLQRQCARRARSFASRYRLVPWRPDLRPRAASQGEHQFVEALYEGAGVVELSTFCKYRLVEEDVAPIREAFIV